MEKYLSKSLGLKVWYPVGIDKQEIVKRRRKRNERKREEERELDNLCTRNE